MTKRKSSRFVVTITATTADQGEYPGVATGKVEFVIFNPALADLKILWEAEKLLNHLSPSKVRIDIAQ